MFIQVAVLKLSRKIFFTKKQHKMLVFSLFIEKSKQVKDLYVAIYSIKSLLASITASTWPLNRRKGVVFYLQQEERYGEWKWGHRFSSNFPEAEAESWFFDPWLTVSLLAFLYELVENLFSMISVYWDCLHIIDISLIWEPLARP